MFNIKRFSVVIILLIISAAVYSQQITVSVSDFSVESSNEKYLYIGKGISTLIAGELRRTKGITLLEREKMNKIIEEQKLGLSGLIDESDQIELGKLMSADYIIFGDIIDMADNLLISVRMADVTTGEIFWEDNLSAKLENYDYIGAYFAQSIVSELNLAVDDDIIAKVESKTVKDEKAIVALSEGIDAYDNGNEQEAKDKLSTAKELDPENKETDFFLSKLQAVSPKFRVENPEYTSSYNPASLGFLEKDKFFMWSNIPIETPWVDRLGHGAQIIGDYYVQDQTIPLTAGYFFPVSDRIGLGLGYIMMVQSLEVNISDAFPPPLDFEGTMIRGFKSSLINNGGFVAVGISFNDWFSAGLSVLAWYTMSADDRAVSDVYETESSTLIHEGFFFTLQPGIMISDPNGNFIFDLNAAYTSWEMYYADYDAGTVSLGNLPLVIDASVTGALLNQRLFLALKGISDIYLDDIGGHALRLIPMAEIWPWKFLSFRAGYEYSHLFRADKFTINHGVVGGLTFKIWKFEININLTYRQKPSKLLPGVAVDNMKVLIGVEFYPDLITGN